MSRKLFDCLEAINEVFSTVKYQRCTIGRLNREIRRTREGSCNVFVGVEKKRFHPNLLK